MLPVKIIERSGKAALVEWLEGDKLRRASVPVARVVGNSCAADTLSAAVPYGEAWEELKAPDLNGDALAIALRNSGVWTREDFMSNLTQVRAALQSAYLNQWISELIQQFR